jgi:hypothetical protein
MPLAVLHSWICDRQGAGGVLVSEMIRLWVRMLATRCLCVGMHACAQVKSVIIAAATAGRLGLAGTLPGTANRLLYSKLAGNNFVTASSGPPNGVSSIYMDASSIFSPAAPAPAPA